MPGNHDPNGPMNDFAGMSPMGGGSMDGTFNPAHMGIEFGDFARFAAEDFIFNQEFHPEMLPAIQNPFYFSVLEALEKFLGVTEKSVVLSTGEWIVGGPVPIQLDQDGNMERIMNVRYFKVGVDDVNAEYSRIIESVAEGGTIIQPPQPNNVPFVIHDDIMACKTGDSEAGC